MRATDSAGMEAYIDVVIEIEPHRYDLNRNGVIEKSELREAIIHYIGGDIDKAPVESGHNPVHQGLETDDKDKTYPYQVIQQIAH